MRKWLGILLIALSFFSLSHIFAADLSSTIRVNFYPTTLYLDGKAMHASERTGYFYNGKNYVPTTIEYKGTMYVPLRMIGDYYNKEVGWDKTNDSAWLGKAPIFSKKQAASSTLQQANSIQLHTFDTLLTKQNTLAKTAAKPSLYGLTIGGTEQFVLDTFGQPLRREASPLGYEWLIFKPKANRFVQVGISHGKIVDIYSNAPDARIDQTTIGSTYQTINQQYNFSGKVTFPYENATVEISNQLKDRPLILENDTPMIFYIDKHDQEKVTGLRLIDKGTLLQGSFYETKWTYQGDSPNFNPPVLTQKEQNLVDLAHERQILDLVNVVRERNKLPKLLWNTPLANVARNHSQDMAKHQFFDHISTTTGFNPFDRLQQMNITYRLAGENIAAGFPDAIEAFHSWMNSPSHRKNVLEKDFTHVGVGVSKDYYTQDFISPRSYSLRHKKPMWIDLLIRIGSLFL